MVDPGKEIFGNVTTLMNKHKVKFQQSEAGNHRAQAFVERANRTLGEKNIYSSIRAGNGRRPKR